MNVYLIVTLSGVNVSSSLITANTFEGAGKTATDLFAGHEILLVRNLGGIVN